MSFTIYLLYTIAFVDLLAVGLIIPLLPNKVRSLDGNEIHVGLLGSLYAGCQLGSGPLIGSLSDLKGRKPVLAGTLIISGLAYANLGFSDSIFVILVIRSILGIFKQTQVLTRALVPDYEKDQSLQGGIYGKMAAISGVGITLGPVIGGHIVEDYPNLGFMFIASVVGSCFILNACIVYFSLPNISTTKTNNSPEIKTNLIHRLFQNVHQSILELYHIECIYVKQVRAAVSYSHRLNISVLSAANNL
ncbi:unnamed protein product [Arctia plantaginis]|uniref:Major facilitator superfamily (MFS) profile domain-containing protein n=1 Tax=Arctia plantaginis TaxID=874455 RepID=A0A8S0ZTU2_ARCPL|nr:unnamed protein product [Arctia plantaginis]